MAFLGGIFGSIGQLLPGYMEGILEAGGLPLMLPLTGDREVIRQTLLDQGFPDPDSAS